jgi:hypothetical protein
VFVRLCALAENSTITPQHKRGTNPFGTMFVGGLRSREHGKILDRALIKKKIMNNGNMPQRCATTIRLRFTA